MNLEHGNILENIIYLLKKFNGFEWLLGTLWFDSKTIIKSDYVHDTWYNSCYSKGVICKKIFHIPIHVFATFNYLSNTCMGQPNYEYKISNKLDEPNCITVFIKTLFFWPYISYGCSFRLVAFVVLAFQISNKWSNFSNILAVPTQNS